jgi:Secretion system C-terminal sorting domain
MMKKSIAFTALVLFVSTLSIAQTRIVLVEQFTNAGCPPCGVSSPLVYNFVNTNAADVVAVAYHTLFPYSDSMYYENPVESNARVSYYSVSGVPYSIVDGNFYSNTSSSFVPVMTATINARKIVATRYNSSALSFNLIGNQLMGSFQFTSTNASNVSDNLVAHVVVIEKNVLKSSYLASPGANSETQYGYVMRKMIPDANGTSLINKAIGGNDTVNFNWTLNHIKDINELRVVTFVQNVTTKEIYVSQIFTPTITTGISESEITLNNISVYPNPATNNITISLQKKQFINTIEVVNQLGQVVYTQPVHAVADLITANLNVSKGVYYVKITNSNMSVFQKIIITN